MGLFSQEHTDEMIDILRQRTQGERYPLSIGTAMIFESDHFDRRQWEPYLYVNIRTLFRNIWDSVGTDKHKKLTGKAILPILTEEMEHLEEAVQRNFDKKVKVIFYLPDYTKIPRLLPMAKLRQVKTEAQKLYIDAESTTMELLVGSHRALEKEAKKNKEPFEPHFLECGEQLFRGEGPSLILTSYPTDLLAYQQFPSLKLLESHTGKIKPRKEWYTKLTGDREQLAHIPFCRFTLQLCGDRSNFVYSSSPKLKEYLFKMAKENNWTTLTTESRIHVSIDRIKNLQDRDILRKFL